MEAPPLNKQKKAHSVEGNAAASGWASLSPELIGTLSKFLDLPMPPPSADKKDEESETVQSAATI